MANRDVNLVIRAKDQASAAMTSITEALQQLDVKQKAAANSAEGTDTAIVQLGRAFLELQKRIGTGDLGGKLATDILQAETAINRLTAATEASKQAQIEKNSASKTAETRAEALKKEQDELNESLVRERAILADLKKLRNQTARPVARADADGAPVSGIARIRANVAETAFDEQAQEVDRLKAALVRLKTEQKNAAKDASDLERAAAAFGQEMEEGARSISKAEAALEELRREAGNTESTLDGLRRVADSGLNKALLTQARAVREAKVQYQAYTGATREAANAVRTSATAYAETSARLGELNLETQQSRAALAASQEAFDRSRVAAQGAKAAYSEARVDLSRLRDVAAQSTQTLGQLAARQTSFAAEESRLIAKRATASTSARKATEAAERTSQRLNATQRAGASATARQADALLDLARAADSAEDETNGLGEALRRFHGGSRQSSGLLQRLRGEVLGLGASFIGFYSAVSQIGQVVKAIQTIEGAQSRLVAINDGNTAAIAEDLDFVRRNSDRLGVSFGELANSYTLFAASTKGTDLEADTRGIFLASAEAARVNNLAIEDTQAALRALGQIASKGKLTLEELQGQLGDRIPGALQIMADGLGITTAELQRMTKNGELTSATLSNFAREQNKRFGAALPAALNSSSAALGRFSNAVFQTQLDFAGAGFEQSLADLLDVATATLRSADFKKALEGLAGTVGLIFKVAASAVENFRAIAASVVAILGLRMLPVFVVVTTAALNFALALSGRSAASMGTFNLAVLQTTNSVRTFGLTSTAAATRVSAAASGMRTAFITSGIGIAIIAITTALTFLGASADKASEALSRQSSTVDTLKNAYQSGARDATAFADALNEVSVAQLRADLVSLEQQLSKTVKAATELPLATALLTGRSDEIVLRGISKELQSITQSYVTGTTSATQYADAIDALIKKQDVSTKSGVLAVGFISEFAQKTKGLGDQVNAVNAQIATLAIKTGEYRGVTAEAGIETLNLASAAAELNGGFVKGARQAQGFAAAIDEISSGVPEIKEELEKLAEIEELKSILRAEGVPETIAEITEEIKRLTLAMANLKLFEESAILGTGAGTVLAEGGAQTRIDELTKLRDAAEARLKAINKPKKERGAGREKKDDVAEALKSLRENLRGDQQSLEVTTLENDNKKLQAVLLQRTQIIDNIRAELGAKLSGNQLVAFNELAKAYISFGQRIDAESRDKTIADAIKGVETSAQSARDAIVDLSAGEETRASRLRALRIEQEQYVASLVAQIGIPLSEFTDAQTEALNRAVSSYLAATDAQFTYVETLREQTDAIEKQEEALGKLEEVSARIETLRATETEQRGDGNVDAAGDTRAEIDRLILTLNSGILKAREFWMALSNSDDPSIAALAKEQLERLDETAARVVERYSLARVTIEDVANTIAGNMTSAIEKFAEAVAAGENPLEALGNAIRSFVADTLIQIGRAITQALVLRAVYAALGITPPGGTGGVTDALPFLKNIGIFHGGREGGQSANRTRSLDMSSLFGGALPGDERLAVLQKSEDVVTDDNPFHSGNVGKTLSRLGSGGGGSTDVKNVILIDPAQLLQQGVSDRPGQKVMFDFFSQNREAINATLNRK